MPDSAPQVTIRAIESRDEAAWRGLWQLYNEFYERTVAEEVTAAAFSRFLDPISTFSCAVAEQSDGALLGFVTWMPHPTTSSIEPALYLNDLLVHPDSRCGGLGRRLIEHVYADADAKGAPNVYWHTQHFNHRAQLLYTKVGRLTDRRKYTRH